MSDRRSCIYIYIYFIFQGVRTPCPLSLDPRMNSLINNLLTFLPISIRYNVEVIVFSDTFTVRALYPKMIVNSNTLFQKNKETKASLKTEDSKLNINWLIVLSPCDLNVY